MNRRRVLKNLVIASGGIITLPFWMGCGPADQPATHVSSFSSNDQLLLAAVADTFIPGGKLPGALSMEVDKFLQKLFDDCYKKEIQEQIKMQLNGLDAGGVKKYNTAFPKCTQKQREELLMSYSISKDKNKKDFFDLMRSETIRGFITSKEVMQKFLNYQIAPGHYYGCVPLNS